MLSGAAMADRAANCGAGGVRSAGALPAIVNIRISFGAFLAISTRKRPVSCRIGAGESGLLRYPSPCQAYPPRFGGVAARGALFQMG